MAGADLAAMEDIRADGLQDGLDARVCFSGCTDHDGDGAGIGAMRAAADGCIDERDAGRREVLGHLARGARVARRHVGYDRARFQTGCQAVAAEDDFADLLGGRQARHHQVAFGR